MGIGTTGKPLVPSAPRSIPSAAATIPRMELQIADERARIAALDASLDKGRTPYLKSQLRFATHILDDASAALRHAAKAQSRDAEMWMGFAAMNLQHAKEKREKVQAAVDKYGGTQNILEIGE